MSKPQQAFCVVFKNKDKSYLMYKTDISSLFFWDIWIDDKKYNKSQIYLTSFPAKSIQNYVHINCDTNAAYFYISAI